jgi:hypothetical protein
MLEIIIIYLCHA